MADLSTDWELVSRKAGQRPRGLVAALKRRFSFGSAAQVHHTTWTVRHKTTGLVRKLTAHTELEAKVKIANGLFDTA
jgi:hypothetical protein